MDSFIKTSDFLFETLENFLCRRDRFDASSHICDLGLACDRNILGRNFTDSSIVDIIQDIAPTYDDTVYGFKWRNKVYMHAKLQKIITDEGVCFTFNDLNSRDIYTDECVTKFSSYCFAFNVFLA